MTTPFLWAPGTNGFTTTPFNLMTTELNALASLATIISSVNGTSGKFSQSSFGSSILGSVWFIAGGAFTPVAGQSLTGWFLRSTDGGTTFEKNVGTTIGLPRAPDFILPLWASAYAASDVSFAQGDVKLPRESCKVLILNTGTAALSASGHSIVCGPGTVNY